MNDLNGNNEFDDLEDFEDDMEYLHIIDDETGEEIALMVIDKAEHNGLMYYLVTESDLEVQDPEEVMSASIFKQVPDGTGEFYFEPVSDDDEFDALIDIFNRSDDDFEIEV